MPITVRSKSVAPFALAVVAALVLAGTPVARPEAVPVAHAQESQPVGEQPAAGNGAEHSEAERAPERNLFEQFRDFVAGGGNEALFRLLLWLFDKVVVQLGRWVGTLYTEALGTHLGPSYNVTIQLPLDLTVNADWVTGSYRVFQRLVNAGLYGVFVGSLVTAAVGGMLGFTAVEAKAVTGVSVLVWYANRRSLEVVTPLLNLANTAAAQFADVTQMLPGVANMSDLERGAGEGANAILMALFGLVMAFVRWMTLFGVNALIITMPLALVAAVWPPTRHFFTLWWRTLAALVFSQVAIALLLGQAQAFTARFGAGSGAGFLVGTCACLWLAAKVPKLLGGLAAMPAQAAGGVTGAARQYATLAAASFTGNTLAGQAALSGMRAP
jgi:hypothetical protein